MVHKWLSENLLSILNCQSYTGQAGFCLHCMCQWLRTFKKPLQDYLSAMIESGVENVPLHAGGGKIRPIDVVMGKRTYQLINVGTQSSSSWMQSADFWCSRLEIQGFRGRQSRDGMCGSGWGRENILWDSDTSIFFCDREFKHLESKTTSL